MDWEFRKSKACLKRLVFPQGESPRVIRGGVTGGLRMQIDFAHHTQRWLGIQERELYRWFHKLSAGINTAIDVGASDGQYTLYFLARTSAVKVLAFEPSAENVRRLRCNLELNHLGSNKKLELVPNFVGAWVNGKGTTLDSFSRSVIPPCLVKVDIDGGELELLRGARNLLRLPGTRWIVEVHSRKLEEQCARVFRAVNYRTWRVPNAWWRCVVPELRPGELNRWLVAIPEDVQGKRSE